jgi:hypothetical protein
MINMKFIHAIVLTEEEIKSGYYDTGNWFDLSDGDYVVHALYDCELGAVAMINDNTHTDIEGHIDSFLSGFKSLSLSYSALSSASRLAVSSISDLYIAESIASSESDDFTFLRNEAIDFSSIRNIF